MEKTKNGLESLKKVVESFCLIGEISQQAKEQLCLGIDKLLEDKMFLEERVCCCEEKDRKEFYGVHNMKHCSNCWKPIIEKQ